MNSRLPKGLQSLCWARVQGWLWVTLAHTLAAAPGAWVGGGWMDGRIDE